MAANQQLNVANEAATQGPKFYSDLSEEDKFNDVPKAKARALMQAIILKAGGITLHQVSIGGTITGTAFGCPGHPAGIGNAATQSQHADRELRGYIYLLSCIQMGSM